MTLICLGLSHQTAPLDVRGQVAFNDELLPTAWGWFHQLAKSPDNRIEELAILSTCNRLELYANVKPAAGNDANLTDPLISFITATRGVTADTFTPYLYSFTEMDAVTHLCRVAAGLESMILGEPQILGQVTTALELAREGGVVGPTLEELFRVGIKAGKRARTETAISRHAASISSVAVRLAQEVVGDVSQAHVLVVGAGEMGQQTVKALRNRGVAHIAITNRTYQGSVQLAAQLGGVAYPFDQLPAVLSTADIVISSTGAPYTVIDATMVRQAMAHRTERQLVIVDIAVPNDVAPEVGEIPGVHLFDIDDLHAHWEEALNERRREIPHVEAIIVEALDEYELSLRNLEIAPVIKDLRQKAEAIRQQELARTLRYLPGLDAETAAQIQHLSRSLVNKLLHEPTLRLRDEAGNGRADEYAATVRTLFNLPSAEEEGQ